MKTFNHLILVATLASFLGVTADCAAQNLVKNGGFEVLENGLPSHWKVHLQGKWMGRVENSRIVSVCSDARTGKRALAIDTTALNPAAKITDELRTPNDVKYVIHITQAVKPIKPSGWYLVKFRVKSDGVAIDEMAELLVDIKPWLPVVNDEPEKCHWWRLRRYEGRLALYQAFKTDGKYHEYVILKEMYPSTEALEVGIRIRAPWTGRIVIDDIELQEVNPAGDMSKMEKLLAMRSARPLKKLRRLNRQTALAENAKALAAILIPQGSAYQPLGEKIQAKVGELAGTVLPVVTELSDVPPGRNIVAVGSMMNNDLVARLHFNSYVKADAETPGAGGHLIWTVAEPYGLAKKQNVIVVAGSDLAGQAAAVDAFCRLLAKHTAGKTITLPFQHTITPRQTIPDRERKVNRKAWGFNVKREPLSGFSKWFFPRWLATGEMEIAELARQEILSIAERYLDNPYTQSLWDTYEVGFAWDSIEEAPVFSDEDRLKITNFLLAYLHMRPQMTSDWHRMVPRLAVNPTWNHQAKSLSGVYTLGRYFKRFYGETDGRYDYYLAAARNAFEQQLPYFKPQENSGNYWLITMRFAHSYYLGEWDMRFFQNGSMRRYAEYCATVSNNKGALAGFGHTYFCYHGWTGRLFGGPWEAPLAFWYYRDGRMLWWLEHVKLRGYKNIYHQDVEPVEWTELLGVRKAPLERGLYDPRSGLALWGANGTATYAPVGDVKYEETFDKISFRENWDPDGQYMLLEGNGRGIHSGKATNQICKLSILGEDLLIGSTYRGNNVRANCSVIAVKDADVNDPAVKGAGKTFFRRWAPLARKYPPYAALAAMAELPRSGFTRTSLRGHLGGTDWHRNVFWLKGKYFALIDEIAAKDSGSYYVESNLSTCPQPTGRWARLTPRTSRLLEDNRGFEITYETPRVTKHYILTDGASKVVADPGKARDITKIILRQVRKDEKLAAGEKLTFINLMYGDRKDERKNYRLRRIGLTEGLIFQGGKCVAYFGCGQRGQTKAILPIEAKMFLLADGMLAVVDGTSAGDFFKSEQPVSRELEVKAAENLLAELARLSR